MSQKYDPTTWKTGDIVSSTRLNKTASDIGAISNSVTIPTKTSELINDSNFITAIPIISDTEIKNAVDSALIRDE